MGTKAMAQKRETVPENQREIGGRRSYPGTPQTRNVNSQKTFPTAEDSIPEQ